jgi:radical SAM superfamily enzyme YgiQ (UPF0313 family)
MKVLLVRPPVPPNTIGLKNVMLCEPLELEYVAAGLDGHEVQIMDLLLEQGLERRLEAFRPDVVGASCYITGVNEVKKVCRAVKRWRPDCLTVVGGVHAARVPEDFADPAVDCIGLVDGTSLMPEIVATWADGRPLECVPGLCLPDGGGGLRRTATRPYMPDPDSLPQPRRDLVAHLAQRYYYLFYQPVALVKTTWGCPNSCSFCFPRQVCDRPYSRSPESIADELERIRCKDVYIVDDTFLTNPERLKRLAALLRRRRIRKRYLVYGRADFIAEHEVLVREWAELGLSAVLVGLEAVTDPELDALNKRTSVDCNRRAVQVLRRCGVDTFASLVPTPDYGPQDWQRLERFIKDNDIYYVNLSPLTPLPGTEIWDDYKDRVTVPRSAHALWDFVHCLLPTRMPLKSYYRAMIGVYARTMLDPRRAHRLPLRTVPPVWSPKYLRLWLGTVRVFFQMLGAHRHHMPGALARAMQVGPHAEHIEQPHPPTCAEVPS